MARLDGKVAFITGAARGQGRSHAIRFAQEGADLILIDIAADIPGLDRHLSTEEELHSTAAHIETLGRRVISAKADVRDLDRLRDVLQAGVRQLGGLDVVIANAAVSTAQTWDAVTSELWQATIDINLTGVWHTCAASTPHLIARGGGSMILTSSSATDGMPFLAPYIAAKAGVVGLTKALANELGIHGIRVNSVHPGGVRTSMLEAIAGELQPLIAARPDTIGSFATALPQEDMPPLDITNAVLFLASDESRYITGQQLAIDLGSSIR